MVDIYTPVNFFRDLEANVLLEKIHSKIENVYFRTIIPANRGPAQYFYHIEIIKYVKNYVQLNFYAIWRC